jgi:hypothetical protein
MANQRRGILEAGSNATFGSIIIPVTAMKTLPLLANIADAVGAAATKWDLSGIISLKLLSSPFSSSC